MEGLRDLGSAPSPFNSFQVLQGLETLHVRMAQHSSNAQKLAEWLEEHEEVAWVNYPGLKSSKYNALADEYLQKGKSGILTFGLKKGFEAAKKIKIPTLSILATGDKIGAFAHSESNTSPTENNIACTYKDGNLSGTKIAVVDGDIADFYVVSAQNGSSVGLYLVDGSSSGIEVNQQPTLDPSRSHASVSFDNAPCSELKSDWSDVLNLLDRAAVLFSFEQLGGAEACLDMAKEYAMGRYAFGRSIASFQAIKHKLADMFIAVELARSNCYYGAWALSTDAPELPTAAATARVSASQAYHECSKENIQTHGGMGFTWEFDCHLYYRRCRQLAANIGLSLIHISEPTRLLSIAIARLRR